MTPVSLIDLHQERSARPQADGGEARAGHAVTADDIAQLLAWTLAENFVQAQALCERLRAAGCQSQDLYLELLTPVARRLGDLWQDDDVDLVQVTVGADLLKKLVLEFSPQLRSDAAIEPDDGAARLQPAFHIMVVPVPGSQHTLGLLMVTELFRHAGWEVWTEPSLSMDALSRAVKTHRFDVVGFSVGFESQIPALAAAVSLVRAASSNPLVRVLVGGPAMLALPDLAARVKADAGGANAAEAVATAEALVRRAREQAEATPRV